MGVAGRRCAPLPVPPFQRVPEILDRPLGRDAPSDDDEIAFLRIQHGDARQGSPAREAVSLEEAQARFVMAEDVTEQRVEAEGGGPVDGMFQKMPAQALALVRRGDVERDHGRAVVGGARVK